MAAPRRGGRLSGGGSSSSSSNSPTAAAMQQQLQPHHHQWIAPLCGDPGRLGPLVEELGGMVERGVCAGAGAAVSHVVAVGMEGEAAPPAAEAEAGATTTIGHTAALARALAGRLGATFLLPSSPSSSSSSSSAAAAASSDAATEEEGEEAGASRVALLCCAWVHSGARLEAAAQGLLQRGYRCVGLAFDGWHGGAFAICCTAPFSSLVWVGSNAPAPVPFFFFGRTPSTPFPPDRLPLI